MSNHDPQKLHEQLIQALAPKYRFGGDETLEQWQAKARNALRLRLGLDEIPACESQPEILWRREEAEFTEIRFSLETEPGYDSLMHLLLPKMGNPKPPVVICLQGHSTGMHISLGRPKFAEDEEDIAGDRDYAIQAVRRGYAALTLEQRAFGECGGNEKGPRCAHPAATALLLGRTLIGERVHDIMQAVTLLRSGYFDVDPERIAVTGNSGGGTASIYAAAMDPRIAASMPSCAFTSYYASIVVGLHCMCNYIPGIAKDFDMGDLCALIAPRPLVVIAAKQDTSFPLEQALEQFEVTKAAYSAANALDKCRLLAAPGGHRYYASLAWPAFDELTAWRK